MLASDREVVEAHIGELGVSGGPKVNSAGAERIAVPVNSVVRVLVADGDPLARNALRAALDGAGLSVVGQAEDASQAVNLVARCNPDVVLVDEGLPPDGGTATLDALVGTTPGIRVILLGSTEDHELGVAALASGAAGYLSRGTDLEALSRAVEGVAAGEAAISRAMVLALIERLRELSVGREGMRPVRSPLTTREWEVLDLLKTGASTEEIATDLVISLDTVLSHVQHVLRKLQARTRAEAVEIASNPLLSVSASR